MDVIAGAITAKLVTAQLVTATEAFLSRASAQSRIRTQNIQGGRR
jgi:hypothetical protein